MIKIVTHRGRVDSSTFAQPDQSQARSHNLTRVIHTLSASLTKRWLSKRCKVSRLDLFLFFFSFFVSLLLSTFSTSCGLRCRPFSPPGTCLQFLWRIRFSITTARRLSSNVANSRFRAFRESICAQEKVPTNLYEYALGGTRTHEMDL